MLKVQISSSHVQDPGKLWGALPPNLGKSGRYATELPKTLQLTATRNSNCREIYTYNDKPRRPRIARKGRGRGRLRVFG
jgi:hypothetical protein